jgi:uncharacterized protein
MAYLWPIVLLLLSNVFMTFAWYGHLKYPSKPLWIVIAASWGIAFFEYCLQVPANRMGHQVYSAVQLKTIQEILTLLVFAGFSFYFLKEPLKWNHGVAFGLIVLAAFFMFYEK